MMKFDEQKQREKLGPDESRIFAIRTERKKIQICAGKKT